jgi:hypothetical protein
MTPAAGKTFVPDTRFETDKAMALLWGVLRDQRIHDRADVLNQLETELQIKDAEDRLKWFKFHGQFPRAGQVYRYVVHDDGKRLCMEAHRIEEIPG